MISVLEPGLSCPSSSPGREHLLCSWARHFTLTVPLFTQVYKWVLLNCRGGGGWEGVMFAAIHASET